MKKALFLALAACGGGGHPTTTTTTPLPPTGDTVTFAFAVPATGAQLQRTADTVTELDIQNMGHIRQEHRHTETIEVVAATADGLGKVKVTYDASTGTESRGGAPASTQPDPVEHKAYLIDLTTKPMTITGADGAEATGEETDLVANYEHDLAAGNPLAHFLAGKTVKKGDTIDIPAEDVAKMFSDGQTYSKASMSITYTGMDGAFAKFDGTSSFTSDGDGVHAEIQIAGTIEIDPTTGWAFQADLKGPVTLSGGFAATGTATDSEMLTLAK